MPSPEQQALAVIDLARGGRFEEIRGQFAPVLRRLVSARGLRAAWDAETAQRGQLRSVGEPVTKTAPAGVATVRVPLSFAHGTLTLMISTRRGRLIGIRTIAGDAAGLHADWEPPLYADPDAFSEQEHTLGAGPDAVPATLTLPHGAGPWPAGVLLAGSGPQDRDETVGTNKPLKDLAWGLASRGIAVARFDKITLTHPDHLTTAARVTILEEYAPQALAATNMIAAQPGVDPRRVVLIGHSLGGTVAPRIAAAQPGLAGLVLLAAGAQPLHWAIVRQLRYLASLDPATAEASHETIKAAAAQANLVDSPELSAHTPANELPFGIPASYWLDLRTYDPTAVAHELGIPILILQGGRDYQVTINDDLQAWRTCLAGHPELTIRVYPEHNHMFAHGSGPPTPADYDHPHHIDEHIIIDVANWIATLPPCSDPTTP
jgi:uncharacterized protein